MPDTPLTAHGLVGDITASYRLQRLEAWQAQALPVLRELGDYLAVCAETDEAMPLCDRVICGHYAEELAALLRAAETEGA